MDKPVTADAIEAWANTNQDKALVLGLRLVDLTRNPPADPKAALEAFSGDERDIVEWAIGHRMAARLLVARLFLSFKKSGKI